MKVYESTKKYLAENEGKKLKIAGKISKIMWQHIQAHINAHPFINYVDLENGYQIIVYTKKQISCTGQVEVSGKVIKVEGTNDPNSKAFHYEEFQIIAEDWSCI